MLQTFPVLHWTLTEDPLPRHQDLCSMSFLLLTAFLFAVIPCSSRSLLVFTIISVLCQSLSWVSYPWSSPQPGCPAVCGPSGFLLLVVAVPQTTSSHQNKFSQLQLLSLPPRFPLVDQGGDGLDTGPS